MSIRPSGAQWTIAHGAHHATIVEVGGGIRTYQFDGADVIAGYGIHEPCSEGRGQVLMPWPNRIRDGRYAHGGVTQQLALTEPARANASHGLVRWASWRRIEHTSDSITVGYRLHPQPGWAGILELQVTYTLSDDGLEVTTRATNVGATDVPFGCGAHPYIAIGEAPRADVHLQIPGDTLVRVDPQRLLPMNTEPVTAAEDFRVRRALASTQLDTAYTNLTRDEDGRWRVHVTRPATPGVTVWGDQSFDWVQVFTGAAGDDLPSARRGIAIEPMSCPADAFNSGDSLVSLTPGDTWTGTWGVAPVDQTL